jgi:hypothetical protein
MAEKLITSIRARGIIMIPRTGNNDLSDDKKEIFFVLPLDARLYDPILFATAVADRG